jgi:hypothetical protein
VLGDYFDGLPHEQPSGLLPDAQTITRPGRPIRMLLAEVPTCPFLSQMDATLTNAAVPAIRTSLGASLALLLLVSWKAVRTAARRALPHGGRWHRSIWRWTRPARINTQCRST